MTTKIKLLFIGTLFVCAAGSSSTSSSSRKKIDYNQKSGYNGKRSHSSSHVLGHPSKHGDDGYSKHISKESDKQVYAKNAHETIGKALEHGTHQFSGYGTSHSSGHISTHNSGYGKTESVYGNLHNSDNSHSKLSKNRPKKYSKSHNSGNRNRGRARQIYGYNHRNSGHGNQYGSRGYGSQYGSTQKFSQVHRNRNAERVHGLTYNSVANSHGYANQPHNTGYGSADYGYTGHGSIGHSPSQNSVIRSNKFGQSYNAGYANRGHEQSHDTGYSKGAYDSRDHIDQYNGGYTDYQFRYNVKHGSKHDQANYGHEQNAADFRYQIYQSHPYGGQSNVYRSGYGKH